MRTSWLIPGSHHTIEYDIDSAGQLKAIKVEGKVVIQRSGAWLIFGNEWVRHRHQVQAGQWFREGRVGNQSWRETYRLDTRGRWVEIDGMTIARDQLGRIHRIEGQGQTWSYHYQGSDLQRICGPAGLRDVGRRTSGQSHPWQAKPAETGDYLGGNVSSLPATVKRDGYGRTWMILDEQGHIRTTFVWWGWACLARIDGPPDAPLAAVFSLDPSLTPVRVVTAAGMTRIPRDAFGENTLAQRNLPGLFGGWVDGNLVHYRYRRLAPRLGRYLEPDPFDGSTRDPRRRYGVQNRPLPSEVAVAGPFAVCRHNPIDRVDFDAAMSAGWETALVTLSSLTWSFQHNVVGYSFFGFYNLLAALLSFDGDNIEELAHLEGIDSDYVGAWAIHIGNAGMRAMGFPKRLFAYQHTHWSKPNTYRNRQHARVFVPSETFKSDYYGGRLFLETTGNEGRPYNLLLHATDLKSYHPQKVHGRLRHLLPKAQADNTFTRIGGPAKPVIPGERTPFFPEGGFHFSVREELAAPHQGQIQTVYPKMVASGVTGERIRLALENFAGNVPATGSNFILDLERKETSGDREEAERGALGFGAEAVTMKDGTLYLVSQSINPLELNDFLFPQTTALYQANLGNPLGTYHKGNQDNRLDARQGSPAKLELGANLLITPTGAPQHAFVSTVALIEAELDMHAERINNGRTTIWQAKAIRGEPNAAPTARVINPQELAFEGDAQAEEGEPILVFDGADEEPHFVVEELDNGHVRLERPLNPSLQGNNTLNWWPIRALGPIGTWLNLRSNGKTWTMQFQQSATIQADDILLLGPEVDTWLDIVQVVTINSEFIELTQNALVHGNDYLLTPLSQEDLFADDMKAEQFDSVAIDPQIAPQLSAMKAFSFQETGDSPLIDVIDAFAAANQQAAIGKIDRLHAQLQGDQITQPSSLAQAAKPIEPARGSTPAIAAPLLNNVPFANHKLTLIDPTKNGAIRTGFDDFYEPAVGVPVEIWDTAQPANVHTSIVTSIQAKVTFSGGLPLNQFGDSDLELVGLQPQGFMYKVRNSMTSNHKLSVLPNAYRLNQLGMPERSGGNLIEESVAMPRFFPGDIVRLVDINLATIHDDRVYRVKEVHGGLLVFDEPIPQILFPNVAVQRMIPEDPKTGGHRLAIKGQHSGMNQFTFSVWTPNMMMPDKIVAVIQAEQVWLREIFSVEELTLELLPIEAWAANPPGNVDLSPIHQPFLGPEALDNGEFFEHILLVPKARGQTALIPKTGLVTGFSDRADQPAVAGHFSSGSGQVPVDESRTVELDNRQGLEAHELRHTQQSAMFGPILTACVPLNLIEGIARAFGEDPNLPEFSPFLPATLDRAGTQSFITIDNPGDLDFSPGRTVQIAQGLVQRTLNLGAQDGNRFAVDVAASFTNGEVFVRLQKSDDASTLAEFNAWSELLTLGGLQMMTTGSAMRWLAFGVAALIRVIKEEPFRWTVLNPDQFRADRGPQPSTIQVTANQDGNHDFRVHDWLELRQRDRTQQLVVTSVNGDLVELDGVPNEAIVAEPFTVERIGEQHPMHSIIDYTHVDGLRWFFDPIGKLSRRIEAVEGQELGSGLGGFLTGLRWTMSTTAWSGFPISFWFFDNFLKQLNKTSFTSFLEQNASEHSGNLYSTIGHWHQRPSHVGDLGIYQLFFHNPSVVKLGHGEAPGLVMDDRVRVMPSPEDSGPLPAGYVFDDPKKVTRFFEPNLTRHAAENPANQLPDLLFHKHPHLPLACTDLNPFGFQPSVHGLVPRSATLDRTSSCYVGFTGGFGGGSYRLSTKNDVVSDIHQSRIAQDEDSQTLMFEGQVEPVTITVHGRQIESSLDVVLGQSVTFAVEPAQNRHYDLTLIDPIDGDFLRIGKESLHMDVQFTTGVERLEIARVHEQGKPFDFNLLDRLYIPVRQVDVTLSDQLICRATADHRAEEKTTVKAGESVFLLVPVELDEVLLAKHQTQPGGAPSPKPQVTPIQANTLPSPVRAYLGKGQAYEISFAEDTAVNGELDYQWRIPLVMPDPNQGQVHLEANLKLVP